MRNGQIKLQVKKSAIIQYLILYYMLSVSGSGLRLSLNSRWSFLAMVISGLILIRLFRQNHQRVLLLGALTTGCLLLTRFSVGGIGLDALLANASRILLGYCVVAYDRRYFATRLVRLGAVLNVGSLFFFTLLNINKSLLPVLLPVRATVGDGVAFLYNPFFTFNELGVYNTILRNNGIYTEPTLMAIQVLCVFYVLFFAKSILLMGDNEWKKHVILSAITLLTTLSTTGYVAFSLMLLIYVLMSNADRKLKRRVVCGIILVFGLLIGELLINGDSGLVSSVFLSKTIRIDDNGKRVFDLGAAGTGSARLSAIGAALALIVKYPLGSGYDNYKYYVERFSLMGSQSAGGGFIVDTAVYGLVPTFATLFFLIGGVKRVQQKSAIPVFLCMFIITTLAESTMYYPIFFSIVAMCYLCIENREAA